MKQIYLSWTSKVPTRPGLYVKTDGHGSTRLVAVSIERFLSGDRHAYLTDVTPEFVRAAVDCLKRESLHHLKGSHENTRLSFLGPVKLPRVPASRKLSRTSKDLPTEPGIYFYSVDHGHAWLTRLVSVSVHRYLAGGTATQNEVFATELNTFETVQLSAEPVARGVFTPALDALQKLNLQMLRKG